MSKGVKVNARVKGRALSHRDRIPLGIEIPPDDICSSDTSPMRFTGVLFFPTFAHRIFIRWIYFFPFAHDV